MATEATYAYRYGLIASSASGIISRYQQQGTIDDPEKAVLREAERLLEDAIKGGTLFDPSDRRFDADNNAVQAFGSALSAVVACGELSNIGDLISRFRRIGTTLASISEPEAEPLTREELEEAKRYFDCLARQMISELDQPRPVPAPFQQV